MLKRSTRLAVSLFFVPFAPAFEHYRKRRLHRFTVTALLSITVPPCQTQVMFIALGGAYAITAQTLRDPSWVSRAKLF
jgi:hypothetical protein